MWFGTMQLVNTPQWLGLVPEWIGEFIEPTVLVRLNGILEIVLSTALALGLYVRFVAAFLAVHLFVITFHLGLSASGVRDFGLSFATAALALMGDDEFSIQ